MFYSTLGIHVSQYIFIDQIGRNCAHVTLRNFFIAYCDVLFSLCIYVYYYYFSIKYLCIFAYIKKST